MPSRINKHVADATGLSRRAADQAIAEGRVELNGRTAVVGDKVEPADRITLDGRGLKAGTQPITIVLNKPVGYVCSRRGQGSRTIYELLPAELHKLKPVGRLDKQSSGLLLMTNDGQLANRLTHPSYGKTKVYEVGLNKRLEPRHQQAISLLGVSLEDGPSQLQLKKLDETGRRWQVGMTEGRNRHIRRTFAAVGYGVNELQRIQFGPFHLQALAVGAHRRV